MSRTILITGAAGGIGRASVALFAEKGWRVIGVDRNEGISRAPKTWKQSLSRQKRLLKHSMRW